MSPLSIVLLLVMSTILSVLSMWIIRRAPSKPEALLFISMWILVFALSVGAWSTAIAVLLNKFY